MMKRRSFLAAVGASRVLASEPSGSTALSLASFNIRFPSEDDGDNQWEHRRTSFLSTWKSLDADIIGVQEAFASQLKEIEKDFPEYQRFGVGRDDGKEEGEHSAVFFRHAKFELLTSGTFWLSDTPDVAGSNTWEAACNRVCTWGRFREKDSGMILAVFNSHWDHKSRRAQEKSPVRIATEIQRHAKAGEALIVMGDFNCGPSSAPVRYLLGETVSLDGRNETCPLRLRNSPTEMPMGEGATFHGWKGGTKGEQIDYILLSPEFTQVKGEIRRSKLADRWPSDHYPITASALLGK